MSAWNDQVDELKSRSRWRAVPLIELRFEPDDLRRAEATGRDLLRERKDLMATSIREARERELEQQILHGTPRREPGLFGIFSHPVSERVAESYPGGEALTAGGWELMLTFSKPTPEHPWLPWKVWARRWERDGDHVPLDHARVAHGRYKDRLPTNRRCKRELAKDRRRARRSASAGTTPNGLR